MGPFLATYLQSQRVDQALIGATLTAGGLAAVVMTPLAGAWVDRSAAKRLLLGVAVVLVLLGSAFAFTTRSPALLIASQAVAGAAGALLAAALAGLTLGLARQEGLRSQTGRNEAWSHAGNIVSALGAGVVAHLFGAPWMMAVMLAMSVGALLCVAAIRAGDIDHAAARGVDAAPRSEGQPMSPAAPEGFGDLLRHKALWLFALTCALFHLGNAAMLPLLNQRLAATQPDAAPLLWTGVAIVVAQLTMVPVALWVSRSRRWDLSAFIYLAILILPVRGLLAWAFPSVWANLPVQVLDGIAAGALGVATPLMVERYVRGSGRYNLALGLVLTCQGVGAALSAGVANGVVGREGHFGLAFAVLAGCALLALPIFVMAQRAAGRLEAPAPLRARSRVAA
ncbi:MFS transporter [Pseudacidovorax intermedius]|uniref:MFS transporter n=1 Tax=Pseudacidovorax intermedius TaxID=433924 RepID=UPI001E3BBB5F|nr:MFS transporter [Pseudacidovorax intermedius]